VDCRIVELMGQFHGDLAIHPSIHFPVFQRGLSFSAGIAFQGGQLGLFLV
jgi:hypothetical protein